VCMRVYTHAHTYTASEVLDVRPGVGRTRGELGESRSTKVLYTYGLVWVCKVHLSIYMLGCGMMIWAKRFVLLIKSFLLRKAEDVTTISKFQSLTSVRMIDCTQRVPNKTTTLFLYKLIKALF